MSEVFVWGAEEWWWGECGEGAVTAGVAVGEYKVSIGVWSE
uniref:Uncharacterized protein n=1 Tax=Bartonella schoenbuchensis (strain DSM 13525 / NCTC 13165 / R1) TaxID=687861 RepID=E6Z0U2_BARSR|nr:hypothetical protein BARSC_190001 [Bartonella schoenbuchensis R1]